VLRLRFWYQGLSNLLDLPGIKQLADAMAGGGRSNSWV
jgi:hypothetical protein